MTTTAEGLGDIIVGLLKASADADAAPTGVTSASIFGIRAWPTQEDQLPQIQLALPEEDMQGFGRNGPWFNTIGTLPLLITVQLEAAADEEAAAAVRAQLVDLFAWIKVTVIGHPAIMSLIQRFAFVKSHGRVDAKGEEIAGQRVVMFGLEYLGQPEDFWQPELDDLAQVGVNVPLTDLTNPPPVPSGWDSAPTLVVTLEDDEPGSGTGELDFTNPDNSGLSALT